MQKFKRSVWNEPHLLILTDSNNSFCWLLNPISLLKCYILESYIRKLRKRQIHPDLSGLLPRCLQYYVTVSSWAKPTVQPAVSYTKATLAAACTCSTELNTISSILKHGFFFSHFSWSWNASYNWRYFTIAIGQPRISCIAWPCTNLLVFDDKQL